MNDRNPYLVTRALNSYLRGSVFIAVSGHLVTTTDAIVVSYFMGPKALNAVNIVIPILTLFSTVMIMLGAGASISIAKLIGTRNKIQVNESFSSSMVGAVVFGIIISIITYFFSEDIIKYLDHGDSAVEFYSLQYLMTFCYAAPFLIITGVLERIIRTDGNTKLVRIATWVGFILNLVLDIIFVGFTDLGIAGAAWATGINYLICLVICVFHFSSRNNTLEWSGNYKQYFWQCLKNCKLGFSTSLNTFLMAVTLFVINIIVVKALANEGLYCWAVCYQIFLILQMLLSGIDTSIFALGGVMFGEEDVKGLYFLYKRCLIYLLVWTVSLWVVIIVFPDFFGTLFGNTGADPLHLLPNVIKIFSFFLLPFAIVSQVRTIYTVMERSRLSLVLCIISYLLIILFAYAYSRFDPNIFWWSFPSSSWLLIILLLIFTFTLHLKNKNLRVFSLIPKKEPGIALNLSVALDDDDIHATDIKISDFLKQEGIDVKRAEIISDICETAMDEIYLNLFTGKGTNRFFDLHIKINTPNVSVILKDDGPRLTREEEESITNFISGPEINNSNINFYYFYLNHENNFAFKF